MKNTNTNTTRTYEVTTAAGKTYTASDSLTDLEAANIILNAERQTNFALDIADHATYGRITEKQRAWLHVLASWAQKPAGGPQATSDRFPAILALLNRAAEAQKRAPFIHLEIDGRPLLVRLTSKGHANVTDSGPFATRLWFGRINADGSFVRGRACEDAHVALLKLIEQDPAKVASQHGVATGYCCFCARDLSTKESRSVGYGPVCAAKFGLPWGEIDPELDAKGKEIFSPTPPQDVVG